MNRKHIIRNLRLNGIPFDENLSTADLKALLDSQVVNRFKKNFNYAGGRGKIAVTYNAAKPEEEAQIMITEEIGKDAWTGEGISVADIQNALNSILPKTRALHFFVDSVGGSYNVGSAIHNLLLQWSGVINKTIIGVAASTASWMIPADKTKAFKNIHFFMHEAMCDPGLSNASELEKVIPTLRQTDNQIATMYADQSGNDLDEMLNLMKGPTLLNGQQAKELGFVDELIDGDAVNQLSEEWINSAKAKLLIRNSLSALPTQGEQNTNHNPTNKMNRAQKIALLNKRGISNITDATTEAQLDSMIANSDAMRTQNKGILTGWNVAFTDEMTDAAIVTLVSNGKPAATPPAASGLSADDKELIQGLKNQVAENRKKEIRNKLQHFATAEGGHRLTVNEIADWETQALASTDGPEGNPILNLIAKRPETAGPGIAPINEVTPSGIETGSAPFVDVQKHILANGPGFRANFLGAKAVNKITDVVRREIGQRAVIVANTIARNKKAIVEMWNSNAIDADLQKQVILQDMLEAYALRLIVLQAFSVKYDNIPLQGTDEVVVPYFPLQTNASVQFVAGTGYTTANDWTENSRKITIGGDGNAATSGANATAGTAKDRLYQRIDFTSYDMRRQPYLNVAELCKQAADKLGVDVLQQIVSRVIVTGNFGAAVKTVAAALFTPDDVADLSEYADTAQWPDIARSLVLANTYKTPLLKDNTFKQYLSYGATDPLRKAQIQEAYGFENMFFVPSLTNYTAANVAGWINHKSAVLCGFAPILPAEGVRALLSAYEVIVSPGSGAVLEYRKMANATTDTEQEIFQSCFGAAKGVDAALKIVKNA